MALPRAMGCDTDSKQPGVHATPAKPAPRRSPPASTHGARPRTLSTCSLLPCEGVLALCAVHHAQAGAAGARQHCTAYYF